MYQNFIWFISI